MFPVALVGAGPGDPGLLTLRGAELLARADLVVYDQLVSPRLLDHAPEQARLLCVSSLHDNHPERGPLINQTLIDAARSGLRVVRLKGGDPFLFGRGGEEAEALRAAGLAYEVVPGVTAALGASACAGIPLTHRLEASAVALVTGHEQPDKPESLLDWPGLARFPGTLVVYMGLLRLPAIVATLLQHGKDPKTPAAAIRWGTTSQQQTVTATLDQLPEAVRSAGLRSPTLVIIGAVVALRDRLAWFEQRPLFGRQVVVTRPREQAIDLVRPLEELGATVSILPTVEILPLTDFSLLDQTLARLEAYDWLVFTSANGVKALVKRLRHIGKDLRALGRLSLAAIGPVTAATLESYQLTPDLIPSEYRSESLAEALRERVRGQRVLLARADRGREVLVEQLQSVADVRQVAVYRQVDIDLTSDQTSFLREGSAYITLTSSNIARSLLWQLDPTSLAAIRSGIIQLVTISPVTSAAVAEFGLSVAVEARDYTTAGMVAALCAQVAK